ncbi:uncharacterized protein LOC127004528 isoform X1 [Eriocheir sinensis]|uniref:uncharacterized protein LOC127004528 isoform X1 n=1 Tax=Eriocheir sinensis TaxID=95602 RepID=UPI0021C6ABC6|nr:uncharacterized protein LOC127004528 isoform X1 [Eriocheir sinensis]
MNDSRGSNWAWGRGGIRSGGRGSLSGLGQQVATYKGGGDLRSHYSLLLGVLKDLTSAVLSSLPKMLPRRDVWAVLVVVMLAAAEATPTFGDYNKGYKFSGLSGGKFGTGASFDSFSSFGPAIAPPIAPSLPRGELCEPEFITKTEYATETQKVVQPVTFTEWETNIVTKIIRQPVTDTQFITTTKLQRQHVTDTQVVTKVQYNRQYVTNTEYVTDVQRVTTTVPEIRYSTQAVTQFLTITAPPQIRHVTQDVIKTSYVTKTQEAQVRYVTNHVTVTQPLTRIQTKDVTHYVTSTQQQIKYVTKEQLRTQFITTTQVQQRFVTQQVTDTQYVTTTKNNYQTTYITTTQVDIRFKTTPVTQYITNTQTQLRHVTQKVVSTQYVTKTQPEVRYVTQQISTSVTDIRYVTQEPEIRYSTVELTRYLTPSHIEQRCANPPAETHTQFVTETNYVTRSVPAPANCGGVELIHPKKFKVVTTTIPIEGW